MQRKSKRMSVIANRPSNDGRHIVCVFDKEQETYYVGFDIEIVQNGKTTYEPYGCWTFYDREDALDKVQELTL